jgi:cysteinyl-tRNA synthetase
MGKLLGNFITLEEFFEGKHKLLDQVYSSMTVRFFMLQVQYRSTLDFSNEALQAAGKGLQRLLVANKVLHSLKSTGKNTVDIDTMETNCYAAMNDDLNSAILISHLMDGVRIINSINDGKDSIDETNLYKLKKVFNSFTFEILGLKDESSADNTEMIGKLVGMLQEMRVKAKADKDFATSDNIRNELNKIGIELKDRKDGYDWSLK